MSGGVLQYQGITLATWSRTQPTIAHSSCEAELVALHMGIQEAKFARSVLADMGEQVTIRIVTDSASTIKVAMRRGLGPLKHLELKYFGLQEDLRRGELTLTYVASANNIADSLTKRLRAVEFERHRRLLGVRDFDEDNGEEKKRGVGHVGRQVTQALQCIAFMSQYPVVLAQTKQDEQDFFWHFVLLFVLAVLGDVMFVHQLHH